MVSLPLEPDPLVDTVYPLSLRKICKFLTFGEDVYVFRVVPNLKVDGRRYGVDGEGLQT